MLAADVMQVEFLANANSQRRLFNNVAVQHKMHIGYKDLNTHCCIYMIVFLMSVSVQGAG